MAGNQGAPIDLTGSPQDGVRNRHQHGGVASPRRAQGAPRSPGQAFNPLAQGALAENLNEALARLDRQQNEAAAQRAVHRHGREARRHQNVAAARQRLALEEQHRQELDAAEQQRYRRTEAMQANALRQVYLRQQHEVAAPQVGQVGHVGQGAAAERELQEWRRRRQRVADDVENLRQQHEVAAPQVRQVGHVGQGAPAERQLQEWRRRRQRVADDVEKTHQRTLQRQQQARQESGVAHNEPAAQAAELERQGMEMRDQAERQRVEVRQQVERQHLEMRARLQEAQAQMIRARFEAQGRVERNGVEEPQPKRARHVEIARDIEIARPIEREHGAENNDTSQRQHHARLAAPNVELQGRADMGASESGRAYDAGAVGGGAGPSMPLAEALDTLGSIFPDIDLTAAGGSLTACAAQHGFPLSRALEFLTNAYFENGYPKREPKAEKAPEDEGGAGPSKQEEKDVFTLGPPPAHCMAVYHKWAVYQLQVDFPRVSLTDVRKCLKVHQERYAAAYKAILTEMQKIRASSVEGKGKGPAVDSPGKGAHDSKSAYWAPNFKLLQKPRLRPRFPPEEECDEFQEELQAVHRATLKDQELEDMLLAEKLNEEEYAGEGQEIECGCCCCEYPFEKMVQCAEGHLFCFACLKRRVEESTFGASSAGGSLPCMDTDGCQAEFPHAEVRRALPEATLAQYEARQAEQALLSAKLDNLVRCPFCDFACEVDEGNRVLDCPGCKKASCRECKEPSHIPLKCSEVEKKGETAFRLRVEELMTKALVRECSKCRTELIKDAGCNKVTCRCGQTMCYICRAAIAPDYTHFCQHFREPDRKCHACTKCNLFTTGNDAEEVKRVGAKAIEEAAHLDPEAAKRMIGAPDDLPQPKRPRPHPGQLLPGLVF